MSSSTSFPAAGTRSGKRILIKPKHGFIGPDESMENLIRVSRFCNASRFNLNYQFLEGEKSCIASDGRSYSWKDDKCYDKIWVSVHGKESICMVTSKEDVDLTRVAPYFQKCLNHQTMRSYAEAIISEVECMPYTSVMVDKIEKPFGVVSVIPYPVHEGEGSSHEVTSAEYDKEKAIEFLKDKMKSNLAFTFDETVQTAISAFLQLCRKELKVEDIWVSTAWNIDSYTYHMHLPERKEYLDMITGASSGLGRPPKVHMSSYLSKPSGTPNGRGWCQGVTLTNNLSNVLKSIPSSKPRPLSCGGGYSSSDDDDDDKNKNKNRASLFPKKNIPTNIFIPAGFGGG